MRIEIRAKDNAIITGYVNVVGRESKEFLDISGNFVEEIAIGAFARSLEENANVDLKFNHRAVIGSTNDNLTLKEDNIGLYARAQITDPKIIAKAKQGLLTGWSFGFKAIKEHWEQRAKDNMRKRVIDALNLEEVSILDVEPAYVATSIEMRDGRQTLKEQRAYGGGFELVDNSEPEKPPDTNMDATLKLKFEFLKGGL